MLIFSHVLAPVLVMLAAVRRKAMGVVRYLSLAPDHQMGGLKGFGTILWIEMRHGYAIRRPLLGHLRQCEGMGDQNQLNSVTRTNLDVSVSTA